MTTLAAITFLGALLLVTASAALLVKSLLDERGRAEREWTRERQILLNRIKPETAQHVDDDRAVNPPAVGFDDDDDFNQLTREQLADWAMQQELDGRDR